MSADTREGTPQFPEYVGALDGLFVGAHSLEGLDASGAIQRPLYVYSGEADHRTTTWVGTPCLPGNRTNELARLSDQTGIPAFAYETNAYGKAIPRATHAPNAVKISLGIDNYLGVDITVGANVDPMLTKRIIGLPQAVMIARPNAPTLIGVYDGTLAHFDPDFADLHDIDILWNARRFQLFRDVFNQPSYYDQYRARLAEAGFVLPTAEELMQMFRHRQQMIHEESQRNAAQ